MDVLDFADNICLARSTAVYRFADIVRRFLVQIHVSAVECGLKFSYDKRLYTVIPPKGKMENAPFHVVWMSEYKVKFSKQIKYLGVVFDWEYR